MNPGEGVIYRGIYNDRESPLHKFDMHGPAP